MKNLISRVIGIRLPSSSRMPCMNRSKTSSHPVPPNTQFASVGRIRQAHHSKFELDDNWKMGMNPFTIPHLNLQNLKEFAEHLPCIDCKVGQAGMSKHTSFRSFISILDEPCTVQSQIVERQCPMRIRISRNYRPDATRLQLSDSGHPTRNSIIAKSIVKALTRDYGA